MNGSGGDLSAVSLWSDRRMYNSVLKIEPMRLFQLRLRVGVVATETACPRMLLPSVDATVSVTGKKLDMKTEQVSKLYWQLASREVQEA